MKRMQISLVTGMLLLSVAGFAQEKKVPPPPPEKPEQPIPPPPPPKPAKSVKIESVKFAPPKIVKDDEVQVLAEPQKPLPPPPPPPPPKVKFKPPVLTEFANENNAFHKRNPNVANVSWKDNNRVIIKLKNKTTEEYDLNNEEDKKNFTDKYGAPPMPPPPPPPVPVKAEE